MEIPGSGEWLKARKETNPDFHLDASKVDDVEKLIDQVGWDDALEQIKQNLDTNPEDPEARRQANLIVRLYDEKVKPLREKIDH